MKGFFRRGLALTLALFLLLAIFPPSPTYAAEEEYPAALRTVGTLTPLEETLYEGLMACKERIEVAALCETKEELEAAMNHLHHTAPELFHTSSSYMLYTVGDKPSAIEPSYALTGEALAAARTRYLLALDEIAESVDPTLSDYEICLYLHDYLCTRFAYDTTLSRFDAYSFLTEGTGVCQSYTLTMTALLARFDIPCSYATGKDGATSHIWNTVTLGGEVYHLDATWGDPLVDGRDAFATATHENFLKSDVAIDATGHESRENYGGAVADDTTYDSSVMSAVKAPFAFLGGDAYGIADGRLYRFSDDLSEAVLIYTVTQKWTLYGSSLIESPAAVAAYGDLLYLTTPTAILSLDPATGITEEVLTVYDGILLGMYADGNLLYYGVSTDLFGTHLTVRTHALASTVPPCEAEHDMQEYATVPPSCEEEGAHYFRCTVCGEKAEETIPTLPHTYDATVVPPSYGTDGYTQSVCTVCGDTVISDVKEALPLPTAADYLSRVADAESAVTAADILLAVSDARAMEPHLNATEIAEARARLDALVAAYDNRAEEINAGLSDTLFATIFADADLLTPVHTLLAILALILRQLFLP